ncbi:P-loop NTPase [Candidatus Bathyarchaeota archaeon]|nr:P-loop NTPase [Candidatus Bathyarchaeota archaeon]
MEHVKQRMGKIKHKIAIISGKGGVGKSLVTVNLGAGLSMKEEEGKVGVLDADLTGPTIPKMMGLKGMKLEVGPPGIFPAKGPEGVRVVSMDFLLPSDEAPVIWRGPLKMGAIRQFLGEVAWGDLEFLLVDLPPGTGDEPLSILQLLPEMDGVVIVTIPSEVSEVVVRKAVTFARKMNVPILGIIENMSAMVCPHCGKEIEVFSEGGGRAISEDMDVDFLGSIPIDPRVSSASDEGVPFIIKYPEAPASKSFMKIIEKIEEKVKK